MKESENMFELSNIKEYCPKCGKNYYGSHFCEDDYSRGLIKGFSDGSKYKQISIFKDNSKEYKQICSKCNEYYTGSHICLPISDYWRGYSAGKRNSGL